MFKDVGRLGDVSTERESDIFQQIAGEFRLVRVAQKVTRQSVHQVSCVVRFGHVDPSHSAKTGIVTVKLFIF